MILKKLLVLGLLAAVLTGCAAGEYETMSDSYIEPGEAVLRQVAVQLPEDAASPVAVTDTGERLYVCQGYTIEVQTLSAGDLDRTMRAVTGFSSEELTVFSRQQGDLDRYDCVWTAAGEGGDQIGRAALLDDGSCHYVLSVMADSSQAGEFEAVWQELFASFTLS